MFLLGLVLFFPLLGFLLLALWGKQLGKSLVTIIGIASVGFSSLTWFVVAIDFWQSALPGEGYTQTLWTWMAIGNFAPSISLHLDALSLLMSFVVTFVGFLIHLYSGAFMKEDEGYPRFFAYMNLFIACMLLLVLADNLLVLYIGWEGVGLCSYLLIGFWYRDWENGKAARKAFITTRIGDTAMAIAFFVFFSAFGTLNISEILQLAPDKWAPGSSLAVVAAALLLIAAIGKSAQLPLQVWLPDAMAGPSPVSALIHAATMVTAGVYLLVRMHTVLALAPVVEMATAIIGAITLLVAAYCALAQRDIKRVLAYSTISQLGYMFVAVGLGAYTAAMFHFMTHAFFKALLFLGAGVVIHCLDHEHDMFKMGGLRHKLPVTCATFFLGCASLAALPLVTAGFYSKDWILWQSWNHPHGLWLWLAGLLGAFVTALYTFRMFFVTFLGKTQRQPHEETGWLLKAPLIILAVLSVIGGFVQTPHTLGHITVFNQFLSESVPEFAFAHAGFTSELLLQVLAAVVSLAGIALAYVLYLSPIAQKSTWSNKDIVVRLTRWGSKGVGFDALYDMLVVKPYIWLAAKNKNDVVDKLFLGLAPLLKFFSVALGDMHNGRVRIYVTGLVTGAIIVIAMVVCL